MALLSNEKYSLYYQKIGLIYQRPEIKASLEIILSVFVVTGLILAAIRPTLTNIAALQKRIDDLESVDKKADNKIAQVFNSQNQLSTFQDKLRLFDEAVPDKFSYYNMAGRIESLARKRGLTVQTVSMPGIKLFGKGKGVGEWSTKTLTKNANKIIKSSISFAVSGDPETVRVFLEEVENMDRLAQLESVVMSTEIGQANRALSLRVTAEISFYFYIENET
jgi:Tfp pilus assembly protein PilO